MMHNKNKITFFDALSSDKTLITQQRIEKGDFIFVMHHEFTYKIELDYYNLWFYLLNLHSF